MRHDHRNSPNTVALHDINQTHLIQQIIRFMQLYASQTGGISINEREQLIRGCCHGFSLVYSYMFAIGKLDWWLDCLQVLSTWTGSNDELNQAIKYEGEESVFYAFELLGELAMGELMQDEGVAAASELFIEYVDLSIFAELFADF